MLVSITDPVSQTRIFIILLLCVLILGIRRKSDVAGLSTMISAELKGFAILAIVFAHIGYYLVTDHRFLFPLSILAGVGVNVFLFLSGYGLTHSMIHKGSSIVEFYRKRVSRVLVPFWIVCVLLLIADGLLLSLHYPTKTIWQSLLGFFPKANLYESLNAPFWYLTMILFYYIFYPLIFSKRFPLLSSILLGSMGWIAVHTPLPVDEGVLTSYRVHLLAFPIGAGVASLTTRPPSPSQHLFLKKIMDFFRYHLLASNASRWGILGTLVLLFGYLSLHAGIGKGIWTEQILSLLSVFCLLGIFLLKPFELRFLAWVGAYSYEIYLLHWPLLYRYDVLYVHLPGAVATITSLLLFIFLGSLLQHATQPVLRWLRLK